MNNVKLIAHTTPVSSFRFDTGQDTLEDLIAYMARVSNPGNQRNTATARKLIKYLVKSTCIVQSLLRSSQFLHKNQLKWK